MRRIAWLILLLPALLRAQEFRFQQELDSIPVVISGWQPFQPWAGGDMETVPSFCDIDADGDFDIFVGNIGGRVSFYENSGTVMDPYFQLVTSLYAGIELGGPSHPFAGRSSPEFRDIDSDGDYDLFSGDGIGLLHYWQNVGTPSNAAFQLISDTLQGIDVTGYSKMSFADLDADGDMDILIGTYQGDIWHYQNTGSATVFDFVLQTTQFNGIDVGSNASPALIDIDQDNDLDLFIGERYGQIWYYRNDGDSANYNFTYVTNFFDSIDVGDYASPEFADIDGDGDYDLFVGREPDASLAGPGDIFFYENIGTPQEAQFQLNATNYLSLDEGDLAMLDLIDIDADGDQDLFITARDSLRFYRNMGSAQSPSFVREIAGYQGIYANDPSPFFCDIDADSDYDLFCGSGAIPGPPGLYLFLNQGTPRNPNFVLYSDNYVPGSFFVYIIPALADIDGDGDLDLFICDQENIFAYYENQGTAQWPNFVLQNSNWQGINPGGLQRPFRFWDIDEDGDLDLLINERYYTTIQLYLNVGTPTNPQMVLQPTGVLAGFDFAVSGNAPFGFDIVDIDGDGDGDYFGGTGAGGATFFRNVTGDTSAVGPPPIQRHPRAGLQISLGPNPANPFVVASFELRVASNMSLEVYDLLGRKVAELASGFHLPGEYRYLWDAGNRAAGMYFVRLRAGEEKRFEKLVLLK